MKIEKEKKKLKNSKEKLWELFKGNDISFVFLYYSWYYNKIPNHIEIKIEVNLLALINELNEKYKDSIEEFVQHKKYNYSHENNLSDNEIDYFFLLKQGLLMYCANNESCIAYDNSIPKREIIALKKLCEKHKRIDKPEPKKFYMVKFEDGFGIQNFDISQTDVDIEDNYNDEIIQFNEGLVSFLNSKDKGMVLLHGLPGTGKTTYIRHLISNCVARFIFLPTNLFYRISDPSFFTFILRYSNSVIILEDVEELLKPRDPNDNNIGISTLLNLSDGLLGDAMKLKIICTFNTDLRNIDQAILRKGRLAYNYKFLPLSIDKTNKLFNKLDIPFQSKVEMPLSEIYNYLHDNGNERQTKPKIGF